MIEYDIFLGTLDRLSLGALILDEHGSVVASNQQVQEILTGNDNDVSSGDDHIRSKLKDMLRFCKARFRNKEESMMVVERVDRRPVVIYALPAGDAADPYYKTILIIVDFEDFPHPAPASLKRIFGLTTAESRLAKFIARGDSPNEIANASGLALATIRSQLAKIFEKTGTRRQADLVALLARVIVFP